MSSFHRVWQATGGRIAEGEAVRHVFSRGLSSRYSSFQNVEDKPANCIVTLCTVISSWEKTCFLGFCDGKKYFNSSLVLSVMIFLPFVLILN